MVQAATWQDVFGKVEAGVRTVAETLREVIRSVDPDMVETAYPGYASVNYGVGPRKNTEGYAYLMAQRDRVNLGFYHGVDLPDPEGLLEGTGAALRHVKVRSLQDADLPAVEALVAAAVAERRTALSGKGGVHG